MLTQSVKVNLEQLKLKGFLRSVESQLGQISHYSQNYLKMR